MIPRFKSTDTSNVHLIERVIVDATVGDKGQQVTPNRPVSFVQCSVKQGAVDIFMGGVVSRVPDMHFGQTNRPEQIEIPCGQYDFFVVPTGNTGALVLAMIWFGGPE